MDTIIGGAKHASLGYELDDVALAPARRTRATDLVDVSWQLDAYRFDLPVIGAPVDAATSPATAAELASHGGFAALDLEGLWTRYDDPVEVLEELASLTPGPEATARLQRAYAEPVREQLIGQRVEELRATGFAAGRLTPGRVERFHHAALEAGLDLLVVQGVVVTAQHVGMPDTEPLDLRDFTARYDIPVMVGGVASGKSALHLMRTGAVGVLVGLGGGGASTTEATIGVHAPQATALAEVAAARSRYLDESGRDVRVIAAGGGLRTGGDIAKAVACGADAVMLARPLAATTDAPGRGAYWGPAAGHHDLPRGRYEHLEPLGSLATLLEGPAHRDDGRVNLMGGLRHAMGVTGYASLARLKDAELTLRGR
ncbi:MAG: GuaB3 family IMP dehydrogenase-related protein [Nitriliruptoraceae bacterium]